MVESRNIQPRIVSVDDPANHVTPATDFSGVVLLLDESINLGLGQGGFCTGTLLSTGRHILTAAHCFFEEKEKEHPLTEEDIDNINVHFKFTKENNQTVEETIQARNITIHSDYNNQVDFRSNDIAIIELVSEAPEEATGYEIYTDTDELGQTFTKVGYGNFGEEKSTEENANVTKRHGQNRFDALGNIFGNANIPDGTQLFFDFDNGKTANDAFGQANQIYNLDQEYLTNNSNINLNDTGLGNNEVNTANRDSGGPAFIGDKIVGVTSYGGGSQTVFTEHLKEGVSNFPDITPDFIDFSVGEFSVDTRVSAYADWINKTLCFLSGTHILTDKGEIAVENLKIGDKVQTAEGKLEPIKWIGKQTRHPQQIGNPLRSHPILIKAGALGNNLPHRDLYVSPDHAMFFEGLLINAGALVNDVSIIKTEPKETFTYYHIELENHTLLLAEGASAESYLPQKENREDYDNGAEYEELYPHGSNLMLWPMDYPRISSWVKVPRYVRQNLNAIAAQLSEQVIGLSA